MWRTVYLPCRLDVGANDIPNIFEQIHWQQQLITNINSPKYMVFSVANRNCSEEDNSDCRKVNKSINKCSISAY